MATPRRPALRTPRCRPPTLIAILLLAGCGGQGLQAGRHAAGAEDGLEVGCAPQPDNVLRWDCRVRPGRAAPVEVAWRSRGGAHLGRVVDTPATEHLVTLWGLLPSTTVDATFASGGAVVDVRFETEALPVPVPVRVSGAGTVDAVFMRVPCLDGPVSALVDGQGRVIWYQPTLAQEAIGGAASHFDPAGEVAALEHDDLVVRGLDGRERWRMVYGRDFHDPLHHDVFLRDGRVWALHAERVAANGRDYVVDGLHVFEAGGLLGRWSLAEHLEPDSPGPVSNQWRDLWPGAIDFSHANSVTPVDGGAVWLSLRRLHAVLQVRADPYAASFGSVDWTLVGVADSPHPADFVVDSVVDGPTGFFGQHHASPLPGGRMALYDNRTAADGSRAIVLALDGGVATVTESYPLGEFCAIHGSHHVLANGHHLVTCAPSRRVVELEAGGTEPLWELVVDCDEGIVPRAAPVDLSSFRPRHAR